MSKEIDISAIKIDNATLDACIAVLREQRDIYRTPEFAFPNGCIHSITTTTMHIKELEELRAPEHDVKGVGDE